MSPGKMIRILSGLRRKPGRGYPFLDLSPGDGGRRSPVNCLLLSECLRSAWPRSGFGGEGAASAAGRGAPVGGLLLLEIPAVRLAAKRLRRREGRCSGRTGAPGQLPASIGSTCCPPGREATSAAGAFGAVSLRLPCVKGAGAHRATEGLFAETFPERIIPGQHPCLTVGSRRGRCRRRGLKTLLLNASPCRLSGGVCPAAGGWPLIFSLPTAEGPANSAGPSAVLRPCRVSLRRAERIKEILISP